MASEFDEIDPDFFSYRYPIETKGNASTEHHQIPNLRALHSTMSEMLGELGTIAFGIDVETDKAQEIYEILHETQALFSVADSS